MILGKNIKLRLVKEKDLEEFLPLLENLYFQCDGFLETLKPENILKKRFYETGFWQNDNGMMVILDNRDNILGTIFFKKYELYQSFDIKYAIFRE